MNETEFIKIMQTFNFEAFSNERLTRLYKIMNLKATSNLDNPYYPELSHNFHRILEARAEANQFNYSLMHDPDFAKVPDDYQTANNFDLINR